MKKKNLLSEIKNVQKELGDLAEMKDTAASTRIKNFYYNKLGKCNPTSFRVAKEPRMNRTIKSLIKPDNSVTTDMDEIADIMHNWYKKTAETDFSQEDNLSSFIKSYDLQLPTLSEDEKKVLSEDITEQEIKWALDNTAKISAPGFSGQTSSFF